MFKNLLSRMGLSVLVFSSAIAFAETDGAVPKAMNNSDADISNILLVQLLDSIENANIDFQAVGSIQSDKGLVAEMFKGSGIAKFNSDWHVAMGANSSKANAEQGADTTSEVDRVMPILKIDAKNLIAVVSIETKGDTTDMALDFYERFDKKSGKWISRPLAVSASNQFNKELMKLKFNWVRLKITAPQKESKTSLISGTCSSEKSMLDLVSGKVLPVSVQCEFEGTYSTDGYNIKFKYVNEENAGPALPTSRSTP